MKKINITLIALLVLVSFTSFISAHTGDDLGSHHSGMDGMMSGAYGFGFMWIFGLIFMIAVFVVVVLLIVWLIKQIQKTDTRKRRR